MNAGTQLSFTALCTQSGYELRPYQAEALDAIRVAAARDVRRQLIAIATGGGKTVIFAHLPETLGIRKMLVLAHREELLLQAAEKIRAANPRLDVGIEQAERYADHDTPVVVASIATIGRLGSQRLEKFKRDAFEAVVVDEAHHCLADSYLRILRYFRAGELDGPLLLGVTATPFRGDGKPLANVFDEVVFEKPMQDLIAEGYLCRIRALRVRSTVDLSNVGTRLGDFAETELATAANTDHRNSLVCSAIEDHAAGRRCVIVFAVSVAHVEALTHQLRQRGHAAECVTSHTPREVRWQVFKRFRQGLTRILVNCGVATEGYDEPRIDAIVMARPTKSTLLYTQMLGRGLRPSPGTHKQDVLVIDVVDVCGRHHVQTAARVFGMRDIDLLGGDVLEARNACERAAHAGLTIQDGETITDVEKASDVQDLLAKGTIRIATVAEAIDVFAATALAEEVERESIFPWIRVGEDHYVLGLHNREQAILKRDALGIWGVSIGQRCGLNCGASATPPFKEADRAIKHFAGTFKTEDGREVPAWKPLSMTARWRRQPPTPGQVQMLAKLGIRVLPPRLTRGAASQVLATLFAKRQGRQSAA